MSPRRLIPVSSNSIQFCEYSTHRNVIVFPLALGVGPPQRMDTCHPVCCKIVSPIDANVRGILSIALDFEMWVLSVQDALMKLMIGSPSSSRDLNQKVPDSPLFLTVDILQPLPSSHPSLPLTFPSWTPSNKPNAFFLALRQGSLCSTRLNSHPMLGRNLLSIDSHTSMLGRLAKLAKSLASFLSWGLHSLPRFEFVYDYETSSLSAFLHVSQLDRVFSYEGMTAPDRTSDVCFSWPVQQLCRQLLRLWVVEPATDHGILLQQRGGTP